MRPQRRHRRHQECLKVFVHLASESPYSGSMALPVVGASGPFGTQPVTPGAGRWRPRPSFDCSSLSIRYKVIHKKETGECRLEISMTFADDAGEYSVFAKNPLGEVSASAGLLEEGGFLSPRPPP